MKQASLPALARALGLVTLLRRRGFRLLTGSASEIVGSLVPLLVLLLASALVQAMLAPDPSHIAAFLAALATVLLPVVVTEALARRWQREAEWGRYIVAFNWSQWVLTFIGAASLVAADILTALGVPRPAALAAAMLAFVCYQLALHWFMARRGLDLSRWRSTLVVGAVEAATTAMVILFLLLEGNHPGVGT